MLAPYSMVVRYGDFIPMNTYTKTRRALLAQEWLLPTTIAFLQSAGVVQQLNESSSPLAPTTGITASNKKGVRDSHRDRRGQKGTIAINVVEN